VARSLAAIVVLSVAPALVAASEEAHAEHGSPWLTLVFSAVNLTIFILILRRYAWPAVRNWVRDRRREVIKALEEAARAKQEAEQLKAEWESRLSHLPAEIEAMRRQAREEMARERDRVLEAARKTAASIRKDAERAAEQEVRSAQDMLRREVAAQALELAQELARQRMTPETQQRFVTEFLSQVRS
jgi:F-type H+-transporting ATPase subunit b